MPTELPDTDRVDLAHMFAALGYTVGVEVGVEQGVYSQTLLDANPALHLYGVDPWLAYHGYREHVSQAKLDGFYEAVMALLPADRFTAMRMTSINAAAITADASVDFAYIDANHTFTHVAADLAAWWPKVRVSGILAGHDYRRHRPGPYQCHVVPVLHAFIEAYAIPEWFVLGHKDIIEGEKRDTSRSWYIIKHG